jgi:hypothetical protein
MPYLYDSVTLVDVRTLDQDARIDTMLYGHGDIIAIVPGYPIDKFNLRRSAGKRRAGTTSRHYYLRYEGIETKTLSATTDTDAIRTANSWVNLVAGIPMVEED